MIPSPATLILDRRILRSRLVRGARAWSSVRTASSLLVAATCVNPQALQAQAPVDEPRGSWSIGRSVGVPGRGSQADFVLFVLGVQLSQLKPRALGADISLGAMPLALFSGSIPIGIRAGGVLPVAISDRSAILPSAGLSVIAALGPGGGVVEPGANLGFGLLVGDLGSGAFRGGVTWHHFRGLGGAIWLFEIGFTRTLER